MNEMETNDTPEQTLLTDGTLDRLRASTSLPEQRRDAIVAQAQAELEPTVALAKQIVADVTKLREAAGPELRALDAIRYDRIITASGDGRNAQKAGRLQRLVQDLRDLPLSGLQAIPGRVARLTASQVRQHVPESLKVDVNGARSLASWFSGALAEARRLARELADVDTGHIRSLHLTRPAPPRQTTADTDFPPYSR
jgi:hypothetical protein